MAINPPGLLVYSVKFLCGLFDPQRASDKESIEGPVRPGRYATAINIHNPHPHKPVRFRKKAVLLFASSEPQQDVPHEQPHRPGPLHSAELGADSGMEIDAADIREQLLNMADIPEVRPPIFIKGWVVLETPSQTPLDVVAVYTAEPIGAPSGSERGLAIEVERVPGIVLPHVAL